MTLRAPLATDTLLSRWPTVVGAVVLLTAITSVLLIAFAWPSVRSSVHDVPIAVAGPISAVVQLRTALDQRLPGGFEIAEVADTADAEQLVRDRQVYGAIDLSSGTPQVLVASAASTAVAQTLQTMATGLGQAEKPGTPVAVRDLAALPADDPRGAGLAAGSLTVLGLESLLGYAGIGIGAVVMVLIGNSRRCRRRWPCRTRQPGLAVLGQQDVTAEVERASSAGLHNTSTRIAGHIRLRVRRR
jgi:hypothetical protein